MEEKRIVLGLDVSTATIGICLMQVNGNDKNIIKLTHIAPKISSKIKGIEGLCIKKQIFEDEFLIQYLEAGITDVVIEEPLLGSNNINTVATLLRFNGMISDSVYRLLHIVPKYISSYDARKYAFPELLAIRKLNKKDIPYPVKEIKKSLRDNKTVLFGGYKWDIAKKNVLLDKVSDLYPTIEWIYDKNGELKKENFDASDSFVCCLGYVNKLEYGDICSKILNVVENKNEITYEVSVWDKIYKHEIQI